MIERDTPYTDTPEGKFFTLKDAAKLIMEENIGRHYKTHGAVWDITKDARAVGLLEAILESLTSIKEPDPDQLEIHSLYMRHCYDRDVVLLLKIQNELCRIRNLTRHYPAFSKTIGNEWIETADINDMSRWFFHDNCPSMHNRQSYWDTRAIIWAYCEKLKAIKKIDHLTQLAGIGKGTIEKVKAHVKAKRAKE